MNKLNGKILPYLNGKNGIYIKEIKQIDDNITKFYAIPRYLTHDKSMNRFKRYIKESGYLFEEKQIIDNERKKGYLFSYLFTITNSSTPKIKKLKDILNKDEISDLEKLKDILLF